MNDAMVMRGARAKMAWKPSWLVQYDANEQQIYDETRPDEQPGPPVTPDLTYDVIDDIADRENQQPAGKIDRSHGDLLGLENV